MNQQTKVLVIDDSATIRRLVDNYLTPEGYQVVLAPTAEEGLSLAAEISPDVILLDHQLPGTTGYDVCCQLQEQAALRHVPVVVSSTLRKKAYVEYADLPNVVDMLPKPYTADLLTTTVRNALDTGAMVVASQTDGSAVPEVIGKPEEAALQGDFATFTLRETLDFLTNTHKEGVLEVEGRTTRMSFYLSEGRIQGATASGLDPKELVETLPEELEALAPVLRMTVTGAAGSQLQGLVELLDNRVVDGRLLKRMLRHQASQLLMRSFKENLSSFQFHATRAFPDVVKKLPLEVSTLALLVDGALVIDESGLPKWSESHCFARRVSRNHSFDRSGLATQHVKLAGMSTQPQTMTFWAEKNDLSIGEARRVLFGLYLGELVEVQAGESAQHIATVGFEAQGIASLTAALHDVTPDAESWSLHETKDAVALKMLLRKVRPNVLVINLENRTVAKTVAMISRQAGNPLSGVRLIGVGQREETKLPLDVVFPAGDWKKIAGSCWEDEPLPQLDAEAELSPAEQRSRQSAPAKGATQVAANEGVAGLESVALLTNWQEKHK